MPLHEIHKPSRAQAIYFFIFCLVVAGGIIFWTFFFNKGTILVEGPAPFTIKVPGEDIACALSPCSVTLTPQTYNIVLQKTGFYDDSQAVRVTRRNETKITAEFRFIPTIRSLGALAEVKLPFPGTPLYKDFIGLKSLPKFPKATGRATFSASGSKAILTLGKELYTYDVAKQTVLKLDISPTMLPAWIGEDIAYMESTAVGTTTEKQTLKLWRDGKPETITSFERPLENPAIFGSPLGNKILIEESAGGADAFYLVDAQKKNKKKIPVAVSAKNAAWVGKYIAFNVDGKIVLVDAETLESTPIEALDSENILALKEDEILFLTGTKYEDGKEGIGVAITEALEAAQSETFGGKNETGKIFLTAYSPATKKMQNIAEISAKEGDMPDLPTGQAGGRQEKVTRLTLDPSGKFIYFEKGGEIFEVKLEE